VHQQLAHVGQALAHAGIELGQRAVDLRPVAADAAQQAGLDLQEGQALRDGVVQFARQQAALFGHGGSRSSAPARRPSMAPARWLASVSSSARSSSDSVAALR
jgi:hypothetical protein